MDHDGELALRFQRGDSDAGERLVKQYGGLCFKLAKAYIPRRSIEDRYAAALEGLAKAIATYQPITKFITHAYTTIRWTLREEMRDARGEMLLNKRDLDDGESRIMALSSEQWSSVEDTVGWADPDYDAVDARLSCESQYRSLSCVLPRRDMDLLDGCLAGTPMTEIARSLGVSETLTHKIRYRIRKAASQML